MPRSIIDLLPRGGRVIDPAAGRDEQADIAIAGDRIVAIERSIPGTAIAVDSPLVPVPLPIAA